MKARVRRLQIAENAAPDVRKVFTSALRPVRATHHTPRKPGVFREHPRVCGEHIANARRDFTVNGVKPEDRWNGKASPDITMGRERCEVRCPSGNNKKKSILRNINKAVFRMKNANPPAKKINIAISSLETELPMDEINYQADKRIGRGGIDAILVIEKDGRLAMHAKNSGSLMPFFFRRGALPHLDYTTRGRRNGLAQRSPKPHIWARIHGHVPILRIKPQRRGFFHTTQPAAEMPESTAPGGQPGSTTPE